MKAISCREVKNPISEGLVGFREGKYFPVLGRQLKRECFCLGLGKNRLGARQAKLELQLVA
jgi:hypothetical protein